MSKLLVADPLIGGDIELFLKMKDKEEFVSAEPFIKGSKDFPFQWDESDKYYAVSLDNVAAEFCIPPSKTEDEWLVSLKKSLSYLQSQIPDTMCLAITPAANFLDKYLQTENAQKFGCEPDLNVYLRDYNPRPESSDYTLRSCGGHIHIGYADPTFSVSEMLVKAMDLYVGIPSVLQEPSNKRKELYGTAGSFRVKHYGVEYRTVSNYYLADEKLMRWAYRNSNKAIQFVNDGRMEEFESVSEQVRQAINTADQVLAGNLIRQFDIDLVAA